MASLWLSLPRDWSRENVLASTAVVIQVLSMASTFVFIRAIWLGQARRFFQSRSVPLRSLLTIGTIGEAGDIISLLRKGLLQRANIAILFHCILVVCFAIVAALAAPIAKVATQRYNITLEESVTGYLAEVEWQTTGPFSARDYGSIPQSLDAADFPYDQLLDFLPDASIHRHFEQTQWANHSWNMNCQLTENTTVRLRTAHGPCGAPEVGLDPYPNIGDTFNVSAWDQYLRENVGEGPNGETEFISRSFLLIAGMRSWDWDQNLMMNRSLSVLLASYVMADVPFNVTDYADQFGCETLDGWIGSTNYSKIGCQLEYTGPKHGQGHNHFQAFPDVRDNVFVAQDLMGFFVADVERTWHLNRDAYPVPPLELVRIYQTYLIYNDTRRQKPVDRPLIVFVEVTQISTVFVIAISLLLCIVLVTAIFCAVSYLRHRKVLQSLPSSKLDWVLRTVHVPRRGYFDPEGNPYRTATADPMLQPGATRVQRRRVEFEAAEYGERTSTVSAVDHPARRYTWHMPASGCTPSLSLATTVTDHEQQLNLMGSDPVPKHDNVRWAQHQHQRRQSEYKSWAG